MAQDGTSAKNLDVCRTLREHGDHLVTPREIDHWAYFPTEAARRAFIEQSATMGFDVRGESHDP